jgi:hypothetical protein
MANPFHRDYSPGKFFGIIIYKALLLWTVQLMITSYIKIPEMKPNRRDSYGIIFG